MHLYKIYLFIYLSVYLFIYLFIEMNAEEQLSTGWILSLTCPIHCVSPPTSILLSVSIVSIWVLHLQIPPLQSIESLSISVYQLEQVSLHDSLALLALIPLWGCMEVVSD